MVICLQIIVYLFCCVGRFCGFFLINPCLLTQSSPVVIAGYCDVAITYSHHRWVAGARLLDEEKAGYGVVAACLILRKRQFHVSPPPLRPIIAHIICCDFAVCLIYIGLGLIFAHWINNLNFHRSTFVSVNTNSMLSKFCWIYLRAILVPIFPAFLLFIDKKNCISHSF